MYLLLEFNDSILLLVHQTIDCSNTTLMSVYLHRTQCHLISVHHSLGYYLGRFFWGVRYHFFSKQSLFVIIYVCIADICKQTTFYITTSLFFCIYSIFCLGGIVKLSVLETQHQRKIYHRLFLLFNKKIHLAISCVWQHNYSYYI